MPIRTSGKEEMAQSLAVKRRVALRIRFGVTIAVLLCLAAVYGHIQVARSSDDYTGSLAILDRLFDLIFAGALGASSFCIGRAICRALSLTFSSLAEEIAISVMLGAGAFACGVLGMGLAGILAPLPVAALAIGLVGLSYREVPTLLGVLSDVIRSASQSKSRRLAACFFLAIIALLTLRTLTPPHAVDEAIYHLSVTKSFVDQGRIHPVYDNFSGNMPFLLHMIYAVCLLAKADIAAKLFSLGLTIISAVAIYGFCARFLTRSTAMLAMFAFFGAGMVIEVGVTTRIDASLAGMLFVCCYAMMVHVESGERGWLYASALLAGFSIGIKYTAGVWVLLVGVMYLLESLVAKRRRFLTVMKQGLIFSAIVAAVASPWFIKNQLWFHNPVYPFITGELADYREGQKRYFDSNDEARLNTYFQLAQREAPQIIKQIEEDLARWASKRLERHPYRFWEYLTKPDNYNLGPAEAYHEPNYLFILAPLAFFFTRQRWLAWLGILSAVFFVFLASTSWIARYLLPIYPALTVLAAFALTGLAERLRSRTRLANLLPSLAVTVTVGSLVFISAVQIYNAGTVGFVAGSLSRRDFMKAAFYYPPIDFINHNGAPSEKVMLIGAQMCYDLRRGYIAEGGWDSVEWERLLIRNSTLGEVNEDLKRQGVTHILFTPGMFEFVAEFGRKGSGPSGSFFKVAASPDNPGTRLDYWVQLRNWATFELYRKKFLESLQTYKEGYTVYRIK
jgi:hypothetical protein